MDTHTNTFVAVVCVPHCGHTIAKVGRVLHTHTIRESSVNCCTKRKWRNGKWMPAVSAASAQQQIEWMDTITSNGSSKGKPGTDNTDQINRWTDGSRSQTELNCNNTVGEWKTNFSHQLICAHWNTTVYPESGHFWRDTNGSNNSSNQPERIKAEKCWQLSLS